nr:MepB family protein [Bacillus pumilus]
MNEFYNALTYVNKMFYEPILKTDTTKGKMAMRVYPSWDKPASKQAIETQKWQLEYFVGMSNTNSLPVQELLRAIL